MNQLKKVLSVLLCVLLIAGYFPAGVFANDVEEPSITGGDYDPETGTYTIAGDSNMTITYGENSVIYEAVDEEARIRLLGENEILLISGKIALPADITVRYGENTTVTTETDVIMCVKNISGKEYLCYLSDEDGSEDRSVLSFEAGTEIAVSDFFFYDEGDSMEDSVMAYAYYLIKTSGHSAPVNLMSNALLCTEAGTTLDVTYIGVDEDAAEYYENPFDKLSYTVEELSSLAEGELFVVGTILPAIVAVAPNGIDCKVSLDIDGTKYTHEIDGSSQFLIVCESEEVVKLAEMNADKYTVTIENAGNDPAVYTFSGTTSEMSIARGDFSQIYDVDEIEQFVVGQETTIYLDETVTVTVAANSILMTDSYYVLHALEPNMSDTATDHICDIEHEAEVECGVEVITDHILGNDGKCDYCGNEFAASTTVDGVTTYHATVLDAYDEIHFKSGTMKLFDDWEWPEDSTLTFGDDSSDITLDLNGHTITGIELDGWPVIGVGNGAKLTVTDSSEEKNGAIVNNGGRSCRVVKVHAGAEFIFEAGNLQSDSAEAVVEVNGKMKMTGGVIGSNLMLNSAEATVEITGGTVLGYIKLNGGEAIITDGTFSTEFESEKFTARIESAVGRLSFSGGSFPDGIIVRTSYTIADILAEGYSFWKDCDGDGTFETMISDGTATILEGALVVKESCVHENINEKTGLCADCNVQFIAGIKKGDAWEFFSDGDAALSSLDEINEESTLTLYADLVSKETIVDVEHDTTINFNGHTITFEKGVVDNVGPGALFVVSGATFTLIGGGEDGALGKIKTKEAIIDIRKGGKVVASDLELSNEQFINGGIRINGNDAAFPPAEFIGTNIHIDTPESVAVLMYGGLFTITNGSINGDKAIETMYECKADLKDCKVSATDCAIMADDPDSCADIKINGGSISAEEGNAVVADNDSVVTIVNCSIISSDKENAVCAWGNAEVYIIDCDEIKSTDSRGIVAYDKSLVSVTGGSCITSVNGDAVNATDDAEIVITGCDEIKSAKGWAVYAQQNAHVTVTGGRVVSTDNVAVYGSGDAFITLIDCIVSSDNEDSIQLWGNVELTMNGCSVSSDYGNAVAAYENSKVTVKDCILSSVRHSAIAAYADSQVIAGGGSLTGVKAVRVSGYAAVTLEGCAVTHKESVDPEDTVTYEVKADETATLVIGKGVTFPAGLSTSTGSSPEYPDMILPIIDMFPEGHHLYDENGEPAVITKDTLSIEGVLTVDVINLEYATVELSKDEFVYNGQVQQPEVIAVSFGGTEIPEEYYSVSITESSKVGVYAVTVTAISDVITGDNTVYYVISPNLVDIKDLNESNVTTLDKAAIESVIKVIEEADKENLDSETAQKWQDILDDCEELLGIIEDREKTLEELNTEADKYDPETVTKEDFEELNALLVKLETLAEDACLTETEMAQLEESLAQVKEAINAINAKELAGLKEEAVDMFKEYVDKTAYRQEQLAQIEAIAAEAQAKITAATTPAEVAKIIEETKAKIDAIPTDEELKAEEYVPGDVDGNGMVEAKDVTQILRYINGKTSVFGSEGADTELLIRIVDVDGNGEVEAKDATQILRYINGKPSVLDK